ncbi:MAG: PAS domain S-box protein [Deltaproteobacteria bacterium]|nr:PAS domain S-box protein [Deltaproteobacteria bacterium]
MNSSGDTPRRPLRVLVIEDSPDDAELLARELHSGGYAPTVERVETAAAMAAALARQTWDLVISDYAMPRFSALAALELLQGSGLDLPFIVVSGRIGEDVAVAAMKAGAHDYLMKGQLARLVPAVERELREAEVRRERKHAEDALQRRERLFRSLIENASDMVAVFDANGVSRYVSPSHERVLGYAAAELVGRSAFELLHPEDVAAAQAAFEREVHQPESASSTEFRIRHHDGSYRVLEGVAKNLLADPAVAGVIVNTRDITERRLAEIEREQEAQIATALARVGQELISSLETPALLERLCRLTTEVLQCDSSRTWMWQPEEDFFAPVASCGDSREDREAIRVLKLPRAMLASLLAQLRQHGVAQAGGGQIPELEIPALKRQLAVKAVLYMALRRGNTVIGFQTAAHRHCGDPFSPHQERLARGIAHIASLALTNARLVEELARANRLKSDFVATMSHELRTPLNIIIGYNTLMLDGDFGALNAQQQETLRRVGRSAQALLELISATLDLSRLEAGRIQLDLADVLLPDLLQEIEAETRAAEVRNNLELVWRVAPDLPQLRTDPLKLKVALKNLVTNAVKFTPAGSVTVDGHSCDGGVEITVTDTGIGIAPEALGIIFEPFRQVDSSSTRPYGGVGLGLYIARQLANALGGTIAVESQIGQGSRFALWVPRRPPARPARWSGAPK